MDNTIRLTNIQHFSVHDGPGVGQLYLPKDVI